jgi:exopolysaccharide production protein ExoQ
MTTVKNNPVRTNFSIIFNVIILSLVTVLAHQTILVCYLEGFTPIRSCTYGSAPQQLGMLLIIVLSVSWILRYRRAERSYLNGWRRNWLVAMFIGLAFLSLIWTAFLPATIYRVSLLLLISLIGAFMGMNFTARNLVDFIAVAVGVLALASLLLAAILPNAAIMVNYPYQGLWRGIFWHKLYLGATMALGYVSYLVILFSSRRQYTSVQKTLAAIMLILCAILSILSDSATGLVVFVIQSVFFILILLWLAWGHLISRRAYWLLAGGSLFGLIFLVTNLDFVFGLFNRSASLTGRVPMWLYVLRTYFIKRPLFGYGFGTFWLQPGIMEDIQAVVGWPYPVRVADSGYMDVLLGSGVVGLTLLLAMLAVGFGRTIRMASLGHDLVHFFPLLLMAHILFINISLSYFVEQESFIWFLLVVVLFMKYESPDGVSVTGVINGGSSA